MILELHAHTSRHSACSNADAVKLVRQIAARGLDGVVITDHHYLWPQEELDQLRVEAGLPAHFLLFSGQEVDTDHGHIVVIGASQPISGPSKLAQLRAELPAAAFIWAHPLRKGKIPTKEQLTSPFINACEVVSLNQTPLENYRGLALWHEYRFTATAGSDTHAHGNEGAFPTQFDHFVPTVTAVAAEIRAGRCRPFIKEILKSGSHSRVTEITVGTKGPDESRDRIIVRSITDDKEWPGARATAQVTQQLHTNGFDHGQYRVPGILEINEQGRIVIEQGMRGKDLFYVLSTAQPETGSSSYTMAARWLGKLHNRALKPSNIVPAALREDRRLQRYGEAFKATGNPHQAAVEEMIVFVRDVEHKIHERKPDEFALLHGDYHPRNIIIGQDLAHDPETRFLSVIDFNNAMVFHPAFDVGYFLAQFHSQFAQWPDVLAAYPDDMFCSAYLAEFGRASSDLLALIEFFKLRASLSIAAFFIRVGKGESREMNDIIDYAKMAFKTAKLTVLTTLN